MSKLSPHSHSGHHGTDLMGGKRGAGCREQGVGADPRLEGQQRARLWS